jgi:hypothetical protein
MTENSWKERLDRLLSRGCPLVEFSCSLKSGISAEVACEAIHRLSESLAACPMGSPGEAWGRTINVQMDPHAAHSLGIVLSRVLINPEYPDAGYCWRSFGNGKLDEATEELVDQLGLSQPGGYDDAQPWSPS